MEIVYQVRSINYCCVAKGALLSSPVTLENHPNIYFMLPIRENIKPTADFHRSISLYINRINQLKQAMVRANPTRAGDARRSISHLLRYLPRHGFRHVRQ